MTLRTEWTEWHLTPSGWKVGSQRVEGVGTALKDNPVDRVITYRWLEEQSNAYSQPFRGGEVIWQSSNEHEIARLEKAFGLPPKRL